MSKLIIRDLSLEDIESERQSAISLHKNLQIDDSSSYDWSAEKRPQKAITRIRIAKEIRSGKKKLLVLPGTTGGDIRVLRHFEKIAPKSNWTIIERNPNFTDIFKTNATRFKLFQKEDEVKYFNSITDIPELEYDFAWFDFLGNLSYYEAEFLRKKNIKTTAESEIYFTFSFKSRTSKSSLSNTLKKALVDFEQSGSLVQLFPGSPGKKSLSYFLEKDIESLEKWRPNPVVSRSPSMDLTILSHYQIFKYIFDFKKFNCECTVYQDGSEMLLYRLSKFEPNIANQYRVSNLINLLSKIRLSYNRGLSSSGIAGYLQEEYSGITTAHIDRWKSLNGLPVNAKDYALSEGFLNLLRTRKENIPDRKDWSLILQEAILKFNKNHSGRVSFIKDGIKIIGSSEYFIEINEDFDSDTCFLKNPLKFKLSPLFLHPSNKSALEAIFRILFAGDTRLHPNLSGSFKGTKPQVDAIKAWCNSFQAGEKSGVIVLPTGMGKTAVAATIINRIYNGDQNPRILFLTHQKELLDNAIETLVKPSKDGGGDINPEDICALYPNPAPKNPITKELLRGWNKNPNNKIVLSTFQTMHKHLRKFSDFQLVVVDEFHHSRADTFEPTIKYFKDLGCYMLGLSATPFRGDKQDLMPLFDDNYLYKRSLNWAIWHGYLTWPSYYMLYDENDDETQSKVLAAFRNLTPGTKAIGFCATVQASADRDKKINQISATEMAKFFMRNGVVADYVSSKDGPADRDRKINEFKFGKTQVLFSVGLFNEGLDVPETGAILILRRSESPVKIIQQIGRGLRIAPGKSEVKIFDFMTSYDVLENIINLGRIEIEDVKWSKSKSGSRDQEDEEEEEEENWEIEETTSPITLTFNEKDVYKFIIKNQKEKDREVKKKIIKGYMEKQWAQDLSREFGVDYDVVMGWLKNTRDPKEFGDFLKKFREESGGTLSKEGVSKLIQMLKLQGEKFEEIRLILKDNFKVDRTIEEIRLT